MSVKRIIFSGAILISFLQLGQCSVPFRISASDYDLEYDYEELERFAMHETLHYQIKFHSNFHISFNEPTHAESAGVNLRPIIGVLTQHLTPDLQPFYPNHSTYIVSR